MTSRSSDEAVTIVYRDYSCARRPMLYSRILVFQGNRGCVDIQTIEYFFNSILYSVRFTLNLYYSNYPKFVIEVQNMLFPARKGPLPHAVCFMLHRITVAYCGKANLRVCPALCFAVHTQCCSFF